MNAQVPTTRTADTSIQVDHNATPLASARSQLYLTFTLAGEMFAIDIPRIREIIEYLPPSVIPMMPPAMLGVINVRGSAVPVIDLSARFGWTPTAVGRRTSIVVVEIEHEELKHVIGLVVDRVNAVTEIKTEDIEAAPTMGARLDTEFISGMARQNDRFVILIDIERVFSANELATVSANATAADST